MKKIFLLAAMAFTTGFVMSQDIDDIRKMVLLGQNVQAKDAIDKYLAVEKNAKKADGWLWKGYVISQLSKDSTKSIDESSAMKLEAFELFKKYRLLDPKATLLEEDHNAPIYELYAGFGSYLAIKAYQDKNPKASFENFKRALDVHDYSVANNLAFTNGYKFSELDTTMVQYAAITANEAKLEDEAAKYHKKITDAGLSGDTYYDSYNFLVDYYKKKKDQAGFDEILPKAKKMYPKNERYWNAVEIEMATDGIAKPAIFQKFDELLAKNPTNYDLAYRYSGELFNYVNSDESKGVNSAEYKTKLEDVLKKTIAIQSSFEANFLMTVFLYNKSYDISDEANKIKSAKPEDQKKKKAMMAESGKVLSDVIPYGENAITAFSALPKATLSDKGNYKKVVTMMKNVYDVKKDAAKAAQYDKLVKAAE